MENNIVNLYDLFYSGYVINKNTEYESKDNIITLLNNIISNLKNNIIAKYKENSDFKDESFHYNPIFDKKNSRYYDFDINKLPLIKFARYLNIRIEKTRELKYVGLYSPSKNSIMLRTDEAGTFLHELAHAVDHIVSSNRGSEIYREITAEMVAITLANIFKIPFDLEYSKYYMESYTGKENLFFVINELKERVLRICNYIVEYQKIII